MGVNKGKTHNPIAKQFLMVYMIFLVVYMIISAQ